MKEFEDKMGLRTGGVSGIGRATALAFAREGESAVMGNRNVQRAEETVSMIREAAGKGTLRRRESRKLPKPCYSFTPTEALS